MFAYVDEIGKFGRSRRNHTMHFRFHLAFLLCLDRYIPTTQSSLSLSILKQQKMNHIKRLDEFFFFFLNQRRSCRFVSYDTSNTVMTGSYTIFVLQSSRFLNLTTNVFFSVNIFRHLKKKIKNSLTPHNTIERHTE